MYNDSRREYIPTGSGVASLLLMVLANMSVSHAKPSQLALV